MVQYTNWPLTTANEYWKLTDAQHLTCDDLKSRLGEEGIYFRTRARKFELVKLYDRGVRGLPTYHRYGKGQLVAFCRQRSIQVPALDPQIEDFVAALEAADEKRTFHRFTDLPPELRTHILELHFHTFGALSCPAQPPITRVSRLIREEALPLFYKTCTFALDIDASGARGPNREWNGATALVNAITGSSEVFVQYTDSKYLKMIRRISLGGSMFDSSGIAVVRGRYRIWLIDFTVTGTRRVAEGRGWNSNAIAGSKQGRVAKILLQKVEKINRSSDGGKSKLELLLAALRNVQIDLRF